MNETTKPRPPYKYSLINWPNWLPEYLYYDGSWTTNCECNLTHRARLIPPYVDDKGVAWRVLELDEVVPEVSAQFVKDRWQIGTLLRYCVADIYKMYEDIQLICAPPVEKEEYYHPGMNIKDSHDHMLESLQAKAKPREADSGPSISLIEFSAPYWQCNWEKANNIIKDKDRKIAELQVNLTITKSENDRLREKALSAERQIDALEQKLWATEANLKVIYIQKEDYRKQVEQLTEKKGK